MIAATRSPAYVELGVQVGDVDVAVGVGGEDDDIEPGHHRAGGVRPVRARRDQADGALSLAVGAVEGPDRQEAGELALAPCVGLDAHGVVAGHLGEPRLQLGDQLAQPGRVVIRRERVQVGELGPRDRLHLRRGVELHRARPKRDHRPVEGEVLVGQPSQVAEHLVLGVVSVEHGLVQVVVGPTRCREQAVGSFVRLVGSMRSERGQRSFDHVRGSTSRRR